MITKKFYNLKALIKIILLVHPKLSDNFCVINIYSSLICIYFIYLFFSLSLESLGEVSPHQNKKQKKAGRGLFSKIEGRGSVTRCQESVASFFPLNYFSKNATFSKKRERRKRQFSHIALQWSSVWRASQIYKKQKGKQFS